MSYQAVPEMADASCTAVGVRQAFCVMPATHTGSAAGLPLKASTSAADGRRAAISPPPSTITRLSTVAPTAAVAATVTVAAIVLANAAPAAMTLLLVQVKALAPTAPAQDQPLPVGVAASVRPAGRRSVTV